MSKNTIEGAGNAETLIASGAGICSGTLCGGTGGATVEPIPTLSEWAMIAMIALLEMAGWLQLRRRHR